MHANVMQITTPTLFDIRFYFFFCMFFFYFILIFYFFVFFLLALFFQNYLFSVLIFVACFQQKCSYASAYDASSGSSSDRHSSLFSYLSYSLSFKILSSCLVTFLSFHAESAETSSSSSSESSSDDSSHLFFLDVIMFLVCHCFFVITLLSIVVVHIVPAIPLYFWFVNLFFCCLFTFIVIFHYWHRFLRFSLGSKHSRASCYHWNHHSK